jgi:outer membrane protein
MKKLVIAVMVLNVGVLAGFVYDRLTSIKTGYIVIQDVFNAFDLKKDYERKLLSTKNVRQKISDSLATELKMLARKIEMQKSKNPEDISMFELKRESYMEKLKTFEEDNQAQTKKYDAEIITQLNQYVSDFGKENGYTYILGNDGNGSLMYATDAKNLTREIVTYINARYRGVK